MHLFLYTDKEVKEINRSVDVSTSILQTYMYLHL